MLASFQNSLNILHKSCRVEGVKVMLDSLAEHPIFIKCIFAGGETWVYEKAEIRRRY